MNEVQQTANEIIQFLLNEVAGLILIIAPIVFGAVANWVRTHFEKAKQNQPEVVQRIMQKVAEIVIRGIQQEYENGVLEREELIDEALARFKIFMEDMNYKIDDTVLRTVLESLILPVKAKIAEEKAVKVVSRKEPNPVIEMHVVPAETTTTS